jgi:protein-S-isoprenylcysteine O-methyltransferase Ste14
MNLIKTLLFLLVVPGTVVVILPRWIVRHAPRPKVNTGRLRYAAVLPWLSGTGLLLASFWQFVSRGRGTPAPVDPPKEAVVEGPYRFTRNPQYLGVLLILVGNFIWSGAAALLAYAAYIATSFHIFVVRYEEPKLERRFGETYRRYRERVPRWL